MRRSWVGGWLVVATAVGCADKTATLSQDAPLPQDGPLPANGPQLRHITPIVRAALPPGLGGTAPQGVAPFLDAGDIKTRFFSPGPTDIYAILEGIDGRIDEINQRTGDCTMQAAVAYNVEAWGQTLTAYAQCTSSITAPFVEFGKDPDGSTWINSSIAGSTVLAHVTSSATAGKFAVHAWLTIPVNKLDCTDATRGSYGAVELVADEGTSSFEMVVAGTGFGYCGAQLKSDGASVYFTGSVDTGATCNAIDNMCGAAADITMPATCDASTTTFELTSIGRMAVAACSVGASKYPASGNTVDVSGSATDSVQTFQTTAPAPGLGVI